MRQARVAAVLVAAAILAALGGTLLYRQQPATQTATSLQASVVTLEDLMAGRYPTALDRNGTQGTTVAVKNLLVLYVYNESDGDWHVGVTDGRATVVITEITPAFQKALGRPTPGTTIDEIGKVFCDVQHENESWHGDTCWEVHPVTSWMLSGADAAQTTAVSSSPGQNASVSFGEDQVVVGYNQTIRVAASGHGAPLAGAEATVSVSFLPGGQRSFSCVTDTEGECSVMWAMGDEVGPGTVGVKVQVGDVDVYSAFEVLAD
jgi:hypothetical protein